MCVLVLALVGGGVGTVMDSLISLVFVCTVMVSSLVLVERWEKNELAPSPRAPVSITLACGE